MSVAAVAIWAASEPDEPPWGRRGTPLTVVAAAPACAMARDAVPTLFSAVEAGEPKAPRSVRKRVRSGTLDAEALNVSSESIATEGLRTEASDWWVPDSDTAPSARPGLARSL